MSQNILDMLGGADGIAQIASEMGVDQATVQQGAAALLPAVLGGFKKQATAQPEGLEGLMGMLGGMGGGGLLDAVLAPQATPVEKGEELVGQILGSSEAKQAVASHAATQSGLSADMLQKLMPVIAMAAAGFLSKQANASAAMPGAADAGGGLSGLLNQVVGGLMGGGQAPAGAAGGLAGIAQMLDLDGDGNPLDDIMGMAQKMGR